MSKIQTIYFQKHGDGKECHDLHRDFGFVCLDMKYSPLYEAKEVYSNSWFDEDGDDEMEVDRLRVKSKTMTLKIACKGGRMEANRMIDSLQEYMIGASGDGVRMMMYSEYLGRGFADVRFEKINDDAELVRAKNYDLLVITMELKIIDPTKKAYYKNETLTTDD